MRLPAPHAFSCRHCPAPADYFDPANGSCPTNVGSNCAYNTAPDYALAMDSVLAGVNVENLGFGYYNIIASFANSPNALPDVTWTDPTDATQVLHAHWVAGTYNDGFGPTSTPGLSAVILYDSNTGTATLNFADTRGFLTVDASSLYASLFANGDGNYFAIDIGSAADFNDGAGGNLDSIVAAAFQSGVFPSFTAEINAQIFRVETGSFQVPEPASGLLLALGLSVLGVQRRRR